MGATATLSIALLAACGGGPSGPVGTTTAPTTSSTPEPTTPSPDPTSAPVPMPLGPVEPGTYVTEGFAIAITLTLDDDWTVVHLDEHVVTLSRDEATLSFGMATDPDPDAFLERVGDLGVGVDGPEAGTLGTVATQRLILDQAPTDLVLYRTADRPFRIPAGNAATVDLGATPAGLLVVVTQAPAAEHPEAQGISDLVLSTASLAV